MFYKFASNILRELSDECALRSFATKDPELKKIYSSISSRLNWVLKKTEVENNKNSRD